MVCMCVFVEIIIFIWFQYLRWVHLGVSSSIRWLCCFSFSAFLDLVCYSKELVVIFSVLIFCIVLYVCINHPSSTDTVSSLEMLGVWKDVWKWSRSWKWGGIIVFTIHGPSNKKLHLHRFQMMFLKISYLTTSYILHLRTTTHGLYYFNVLLKKRTNKFMHCSTSNNLFAAPSVYYFVWSLQVIELIFHKQGIIAVPSPEFPVPSSRFAAIENRGIKIRPVGLPVFFLAWFHWCLVIVALRRGDDMTWIFFLHRKPTISKKHEHEQMIFVGTYILLGFRLDDFFFEADLERWNFLIFMLRSNAAVLTVNWWIQCSSGKVHREWSL